MKKQKLEIKEYAKELYLEPDEKGKHKYTFRQISESLQKKFGKRIPLQTIDTWAKNEGWKTLWEEAVKRGITEDININSNGTYEEKYSEKIIEAKKDFIRKYKTLNNITYQIELLNLVEVGQNGEPLKEKGVYKIKPDISLDEAHKINVDSANLLQKEFSKVNEIEEDDGAIIVIKKTN